MSEIQNFWLIIVSLICGIGSATEEFQSHRPLISATLAGLALGNIEMGVICGATLEVISIGWMTIGLSVPPDTALSGIMISLIVIKFGQPLGIATGIAIPIALIGAFLLILQKSTLDIAVMHWVERGILKDKFNRIDLGHYLCGVFSGLRVAIPVFLIANISSLEGIKDILDSVPVTIINGMQSATGILVCVGFAMLMNLINRNEFLPFLFLGFLAITFTKMTMVALLIFGVSIAVIYYYFYNIINKVNDDREIDFINEKKESIDNVRKKDLIKVFVRTHFYQLSWNFERMQNLCYLYCIYPIIKRLYKNNTDIKREALNNLEYFNTQPYVASAILGVSIASMEDSKIKNEEKLDFKVALMGPFAGIGDPVFWGTLRPMLGVICAGIASSGNVVGPIIYFISFNFIREIFRYTLLFRGYREGSSLISNIRGVMPKIKECMGVLSYIIIGGMIAKWTLISLSITLYSYLVNGQLVDVTLQSQLDTIMPNLLPLLLTFLIYFLIRKKVQPIVCMGVIILISIIFTTLGIF